MPAFEEEVDAVVEERIEFQFLTAPVAIVAENGRLTGLECVKMELGEPDESGRRRPVPIEGSEFVMDLDTLIVAIGEQPEADLLAGLKDVQIARNGALVVSPETLATGKEGVFAGGDVVTGPNTVLDAMAAGKLAAEMIDKHLKGEPVKREYGLTRPSTYVPPVELTDEEIESAERPATPALAVAERMQSLAEVELNYTEEMAVREARRCLRCDLETRDAKRDLEKHETEGGGCGG